MGQIYDWKWIGDALAYILDIPYTFNAVWPVSYGFWGIQATKCRYLSLIIFYSKNAANIHRPLSAMLMRGGAASPPNHTLRSAAKLKR